MRLLLTAEKRKELGWRRIDSVLQNVWKIVCAAFKFGTRYRNNGEECNDEINWNNTTIMSRQSKNWRGNALFIIRWETIRRQKLLQNTADQIYKNIIRLWWQAKYDTELIKIAWQTKHMIRRNMETENMERRPGMEAWVYTFTKRWDENQK